MTERWRLKNGGGRPPLPRPVGVSKRLLVLTSTDEEWLTILDALPGDTVERAQWILAAVRQSVGKSDAVRQAAPPE